MSKMLKIKSLNLENKVGVSRKKCSQHKQIKKRTANAHNTNHFFYLQRVSLFGCVVSICSTRVVKLTKLFS